MVRIYYLPDERTLEGVHIRQVVVGAVGAGDVAPLTVGDTWPALMVALDQGPNLDMEAVALSGQFHLTRRPGQPPRRMTRDSTRRLADLGASIYRV